MTVPEGSANRERKLPSGAASAGGSLTPAKLPKNGCASISSA